MLGPVPALAPTNIGRAPAPSEVKARSAPVLTAEGCVCVTMESWSPPRAQTFPDSDALLTGEPKEGVREPTMKRGSTRRFILFSFHLPNRTNERLSLAVRSFREPDVYVNYDVLRAACHAAGKHGPVRA